MKELDIEELERLKQRIVLVDTSMLLLLAEGIDVIDQIKEMGGICVVTSSVLEELEKLAKMRGVKGRKAFLSLKIVKDKCYLLRVRYHKHTDDDLAEIALKYRLAVATADTGLRRRLLRKVPTIYLRESQRRLFTEDFFAY